MKITETKTFHFHFQLDKNKYDFSISAKDQAEAMQILRIDMGMIIEKLDSELLK